MTRRNAIPKHPARLRTPDVYTPELAERICRKVATLGVSAHVAAASEGVTSTSTVSTWVAKSESGDPRYAGFSEKLARARAEAECLLVARALSGGKGSAQATWMLERKFHKEYGRREHLTVAGDQGQPLVVSAVQELRQVISTLSDRPALSSEIDRAMALRDIGPANR